MNANEDLICYYLKIMVNKELQFLTEEVVNDTLADLRVIRKTAEGDSNKDQLLTKAERLVQSGIDDLLISLNEKETAEHIIKQSDSAQLFYLYGTVFQNGLKADIFSNHSGNLSWKNLSNPQLLIFSPLSSDYLLAAFIQRCTQEYLHSSSFSLKPIILSERMPGYFPRVLAIPDARDPAFGNIQQTGVFIDYSGSERTMMTTIKAAEEFQNNLMVLRRAA